MSESGAGTPSSGSAAGGKDASGYECDQCGNRYADSTGLHRHYGSDNNDCVGRECPTCGQDDLISKQSVIRHHAIQHGESLVQKTVNCANCGDEKQVKRSVYEQQENFFCSKPCMYDYGKLEVTCDNCGEEFTKHRSEYEVSERHYCSWECNIIRSEKSCNICGEVFRVPPSLDRVEYCSRECAGKGKRRRIGRTCLHCGEQFETTPSQDDYFCSKPCWFKYSGETKPERATRLVLERMGVEYEQEWPIPGTRFSADFFLPNANTVIEVDGSYWHTGEESEDRDWRKDITVKILGLDIMRIDSKDALRMAEAVGVSLTEV